MVRCTDRYLATGKSRKLNVVPTDVAQKKSCAQGISPLKPVLLISFLGGLINKFCFLYQILRADAGKEGLCLKFPLVSRINYLRSVYIQVKFDSNVGGISGKKKEKKTLWYFYSSFNVNTGKCLWLKELNWDDW